MLHNRSMRVYVFKTHHNLQFSTQMLQNKINESLCLKPTTIFSFHHKCYRTKSMRVYVFKTHHNLQFSPQMLQNKINESLCLQNPPQSSVFTTNATEPDRWESISPKPTTIFSFHHKCYRTKSMRVYVFKTHHNLQFSPQMLQNQIDESLCLKPTTIFSFHHKCYKTKSMRIDVFKTHHNFQFSPQMLHNKIDESLCLQSPPQSSVFTTNATEPDL